MKALRYAVMSLGVAMMPAIAHAQACVGTPIGGGQFGISADMGVGDGFKTYGGGLHANLAGPLTFSVGGATLRPNEGGESVTNLALQGGFEALSLGNLSVCPTVGAGYSMSSVDFGEGDVDMSQINVPVGLGLGTTLPAGNFAVTLYAIPQFVWYRTSAEMAGVSVSDSDNMFLVQSGVRFSFSSFYAGAGLAVNNQEGSDPIYNFGIGYVLGGDNNSGLSTGKR